MVARTKHAGAGDGASHDGVAGGTRNEDIAEEVGAASHTVARCRGRFLQAGLAGREKDAPRSGRKPTLRNRLARQIVKRTTQERPANAPPWSGRTLAEERGGGP